MPAQFTWEAAILAVLPAGATSAAPKLVVSI
jgi:hypothetical protein